MLFQRHSAPNFRFIILFALSLCIMFYDQKKQQSERLHIALSAAVAPLQFAISAPFDVLGWAKDSFTTHQKLLTENADLNAELLLQQAQIQKILELERENAQLRALLKSASYLTSNVKMAQILAVDVDPYLSQAILDKGSQNGVFVGQPVIDATGVMGQVIQVGFLTSRVMLITDSRSAVPVQDVRTGVRAIAAGTGPQRPLSLTNVPDTADIKVGDKLLTSGLDLLYPVGYPLGVVKTVDFQSGEPFATITVEPAANLNESRQVLLMWLPAQAVYEEAKQDLVQISKERQVPTTSFVAPTN
ncbi:MAG: rod shape-determining protein MreC [Legionellales bacterium]|nr:rod shape-determining protein MreC [Legionellales bacterium]